MVTWNTVILSISLVIVKNQFFLQLINTLLYYILWFYIFLLLLQFKNLLLFALLILHLQKLND